ncbi:protein of unknown function [Flexibacter flexilis DSM 6793]|uniref:DUF4154 domain-containing protein n=1 Tax=Flexibacter flexilis DSM 6793 TaxID=927664 RepID=A0A1I1HQE3_9BACT|nr:YfiR family protein [Flexibacter flexilis]SFC26071.1 protein of unknown function [Flexibacter flexilis DSM 6793]
MKKHLQIIFTIILFSFNSYAQNSDHKFHSVFIMNFIKYIQWPNVNSDFVIGVLGNADIVEELERSVANKNVSGQKIIVKTFDKVSDIDNCQVLYIPQGKSKLLADVITKVSGKNTLIITEKSGLADKGSGINFVLKDGRWKFELNKDATEKAGLKVSSDLLRLAILI